MISEEQNPFTYKRSIYPTPVNTISTFLSCHCNNFNQNNNHVQHYSITSLPCAIQSLSIIVFLLLPPSQALLVFLLVTDGDTVLLTILHLVLYYQLYQLFYHYLRNLLYFLFLLFLPLQILRWCWGQSASLAHCSHHTHTLNEYCLYEYH